MAFDIYSSGALVRVLESLENEPITFFRDRYFPFVQNSTDEKIYFDVIDKVRRLAPFVSPLHEGKVMEHRGYSTRVFEPAYLKPKGVINPNDQFRRRAGERIGGSLTPQQRWDMQVRQTLEEHNEAITMREEVMCAEALRLGQVTVSGPGYGTVVVQFGRHADLTITLTGSDTWDDPSQDGLVLAQIEAWAQLIRKHSGGAIAREVVMDPDAMAAFKARLTDAQLKVLFDSLRGSESRMELGPRLAEKVRFEGRIGDFDFWSYADTYQDEDGNEQHVMPSGQVVMASTLIEGTRAYAAIREARAGFQPFRAWPKMWEEQDPSVTYLMTQSAPLMVPLRPNASLGAMVL